MKGGVKYGDKICNIHQLCDVNYFIYLFVIVLIKPYIGLFEAVSCQIAKVWTSQIINRNKNYVNNATNLLFSLCWFMCSFHNLITTIFSCNSLC